jgi:hypothetical protein
MELTLVEEARMDASCLQVDYTCQERAEILPSLAAELFVYVYMFEMSQIRFHNCKIGLVVPFPGCP